MKNYLLALVSLAVAFPTFAQASREDVQFALSHANTASMFATKAELCGWPNEGIDWGTLRIHAVTWALTTNETVKKLNDQQQVALIARVTNPEIVGKMRVVLQKQIEKGMCTDTAVPTNQDLWTKLVSIAKNTNK
jgi:hypothetical protein